jgi:hypothetical protein
MLRSARLCLVALLRGLRFVGNTLKPFVLRCLLFCPHVLRSLRRIWPPCSRTSPKDIPKKKEPGGQAQPSFPRASGCEEYSIIYASRDPNRSSEPQLPLGSRNTSVLQLDPIVGQSQTAPHNPASQSSIEHDPSPSSPHPLSDRHFPGGSTSFIANPDDMQLPHIPSPLPHSHGFLQSTTLDSTGDTQIPDIVISPPSGPETAGTAEADGFSPSPVSFQEGHLSRLPTAGAEHLTLDLSYPGSLGLVQENARHSGESLRPNTLAPPSNLARLACPSQVTLMDIPTVNYSGNWSDGKKRRIGLMHSEQVSRYVNKGDV